MESQAKSDWFVWLYRGKLESFNLGPGLQSLQYLEDEYLEAFVAASFSVNRHKYLTAHFTHISLVVTVGLDCVVTGWLYTARSRMMVPHKCLEQNSAFASPWINNR